jgi:cellulose synthase/poly-beta-1,6-N-acetylglucosamine synthase-like glycosyltransferase
MIEAPAVPTATLIGHAILWGSLGGVAYTYFGYPIVIWGCSTLFGSRSQESRAFSAKCLPRVELVIAAHDEAEVIGERIRNALASDYPSERLSILVASDGSTDGTASIARSFGPRVRVLDRAERRGKAATLNEAIASVDAEIVVLSDANTMFEPDAIRRLVDRLADPAIGVACGRLVLRDLVTGRNVDGLYWRYETFLKRCEGRLGGLLGANGAIYAIRRELVVPLPAGTIVDDFALPLLARIRSGCRIAFVDDAIAHEETAPSIGGEFRRRSRIGVGGFQSLWMLRALLAPTQGWTAFAFWSHKVLRWITPFFLAAALASAALLAGSDPAARIALVVQLALYGVALLGAIAPRRWPVSRLLRVVTMFVCMNAALAVGFARWVRGGQAGIWRRTARTS